MIIQQFNKDFPDNATCLKWLFVKRYGTPVCPKCKAVDKYHRQGNTSHFVCACGQHQLSPKKDTIFEKSDTDLYKWFYALFLFSNSKNGVSAKELQRQLGCTYKCAWRIGTQIRKLFDEYNIPLSNTVEFDETYHGGKARYEGKPLKRGRGSENKTPVFGMVERKGKVVAKVTVDTRRKTVLPLIREHVKIGTQVMTDEYRPYATLTKEGYTHQTVNHGAKEYVRGNVYVNTLEGFWSQLKRSIDGTFHMVSPKYLQNYVDQFSWMYNHRFGLVFDALMAKAGQPV